MKRGSRYGICFVAWGRGPAQDDRFQSSILDQLFRCISAVSIRALRSGKIILRACPGPRIRSGTGSDPGAERA